MVKEANNSKSIFFRTIRLFTVLLFGVWKQGFKIKVKRKAPVDIMLIIINSRIEVRLIEVTSEDL
jgi:hypothetical protein